MVICWCDREESQVWEVGSAIRNMHKCSDVPRLGIDHVDAASASDIDDRHLSWVIIWSPLQPRAAERLVLQPWNIGHFLALSVD